MLETNQKMKISLSNSHPSLAPLIVASCSETEIEFIVNSKSEFSVNGVTCSTDTSFCRHLAKGFNLCGETIFEKLENDHWICFAIGPLVIGAKFEKNLEYLNRELSTVTYLVGNTISLADIFVWAYLNRNERWLALSNKKELYGNVCRWYSFIESQKCVQKGLQLFRTMPQPQQEIRAQQQIKSENVVQQKGQLQRQKPSQPQQTKDEGKFIKLTGAVQNEVVVRFPPEASGYLHIGHAKAALLNQYYKDLYNGKLIMRFDDTNPAKEKVDFEKVILEDLELLKITPDIFTHTSDYFDKLLEYCEQLLREGKAYADDCDADQMRLEREKRVESSNRDNAISKNLEMWEEMKKGTEFGQKCCIRAKIDMNSDNGCMRDPTMYRCKNELHPKTGDKYKVYPTYDFACPIVDSIEGVTHCLRTTEYHDRDAQFYWFLDALGLRKPHIWEYSRLNMTNTVLSKRKLAWFVDQGLVEGWDDPRFPTVRGILRRGMTVEGLKQFIIAQGSSRSVVSMEWDKIWAFNKKVIDPIVPRYTALEVSSLVWVVLYNTETEPAHVKLHPKNDLGVKTVMRTQNVLIEQADAQQFKMNDTVTFVSWGNFTVKRILKTDDKIDRVEVEPNLTNCDYKNTLKVTWIPATELVITPPCVCVYFDHIITKPVLGKDEDFKQYINWKTKVEHRMLGEPALADVKKGQIIQLLRKGFYICEKEYSPVSIHTGCDSPMILYFIPDGHSKETPTTASIKSSTTTAEKSTKTEARSTKKSTKKVASTSKAAMAEMSKNEDAEKNVLLVNEDDYQRALIILEGISDQGKKIRLMKETKCDKRIIDEEVDFLLKFKEEFKNITKTDWRPNVGVQLFSLTAEDLREDNMDKATKLKNLTHLIELQTDRIRYLQSKKKDKNLINTEVTNLSVLKDMFIKLCTGTNKVPDADQNSYTISGYFDKFSKEQYRRVRLAQKLIKFIEHRVDNPPLLEELNRYLERLRADYKEKIGWDYKLQEHELEDEEMKVEDIMTSQYLLEQALHLANYEPSRMEMDEQALNKIKSTVRRIMMEEDEGEILRVRITDQIRHLNEHSTTAPKETLIREKDALFVMISDYIGMTGRDYLTVTSETGANPTRIPFEMLRRSLDNVVYGCSSEATAERAPGTAPKESAADKSPSVDDAAQQLFDKVSEQGLVVRRLKEMKADKKDIDAEVQLLLKLKAEYKEATGIDYKPPSASKESKASSSKSSKNKNDGQEKPKKPAKVLLQTKEAPTVDQSEQPGSSSGPKKQTRLGLEVKKVDCLPDWYSQVITKGELIEYYDISGCYTLRPWSFYVWKTIRTWFSEQLEYLDVDECYFPIFVSKNALEREKTHISDFAPEVAWVTKSGDSDLEEPIAIRPTSETVMYPAYAKWIRSHRDLPLKLNQWSNVVRWEFKHPQPFLRTREFLWQEGHSAFVTKEEADNEVLTILELYKQIYEDLLAVPVVKGRKTEKEKFPGADYTTTVEAFIAANGRAIQGATSHHLGQNFSKMFEISYEDPTTKTKQFVFQNSWGLTTRTVGVMVMVHSDDKGLVMPPKVSKYQVVVVACGIGANTAPEERSALESCCTELTKTLKQNGIRAYNDDRDNYSPGWKFNHWELKGVPLRLEVGPKDLKSNEVVVVRRDNGDKTKLSNDGTIIVEIKKMFENIHKSLFERASTELKNHIVQCEDWSVFIQKLNEKNLILSPFCGDVPCEDQIKKLSARDEGLEPGAPSMGAKSLCIPFDQPNLDPSFKCIGPDCSIKPKYYTLFGRSY